VRSVVKPGRTLGARVVLGFSDIARGRRSRRPARTAHQSAPPAELAEAIGDVMRRTPWRRAVSGGAGRALAETRLSLGSWAARVTGLYQHALADGAG